MGEAAMQLSPLVQRHAEELLASDPLDGDALRAVVLEIRGMRDAPIPGIGGPDQERAEQRWRCENPHCLNKGQWWISAQGVVNCQNCRRPAFPELVLAEGTTEDAPRVELDCSNQAITGALRALLDDPDHLSVCCSPCPRAPGGQGGDTWPLHGSGRWLGYNETPFSV
jgi:hypothetical protein